MKKKLPKFVIDNDIADDKSYFLSDIKATRNEYKAVVTMVNFMTGIGLGRIPSYSVYCNADVYFDVIKNIDFNEFDLYEVWAK